MVRKQKNLTFKQVNPLESAEYEFFTEIGRCLHLEDVEQANEKGMFVPQWLYNSQFRLQQKVLWFAPVQSMEEHNFYGNITFSIKWKGVLHRFRPYNMYLIDQSILKNHAYTRVLLTRNNYDDILEEVDMTSDSDGSALVKNGSSYVHAHSCICKSSVGPHELQLGIEVSEDDCKWIFAHCTPKGNNHSLANTLNKNNKITNKFGNQKKYQSYKCFKYNTAHDKECPHAYSKDESEIKLESIGLTQSSNKRGKSKQRHKSSDRRGNSSNQRKQSSDQRNNLPLQNTSNPTINDGDDYYHDHNDEQVLVVEPPSSVDRRNRRGRQKRRQGRDEEQGEQGEQHELADEEEEDIVTGCCCS